MGYISCVEESEAAVPSRISELLAVIDGYWSWSCDGVGQPEDGPTMYTNQICLMGQAGALELMTLEDDAAAERIVADLKGLLLPKTHGGEHTHVQPVLAVPEASVAHV
jgi:hypothetical protein